MARILSRLLAPFEAAYRTATSQDGSPKDIEIASPITVVHDVSRDSTLGGAVGERAGWWVVVQQLSTGGATSNSTGIALRNLDTNGFAYDRDLNDAYLVDVWSSVATASGPDVTEVVAGISGPSLGIIAGGTTPLPTTANLVYFADDFTATAFSGRVLGTATQLAPGGPLPRFIYPATFAGSGTDLFAGISTSAAADVQIGFLIWVGVRGTVPPGLL